MLAKVVLDRLRMGPNGASCIAESSDELAIVSHKTET